MIRRDIGSVIPTTCHRTTEHGQLFRARTDRDGGRRGLNKVAECETAMMTKRQASYDPERVESRCQERWRREQVFVTPPEMPGRNDTFVYACTPFTTGSAHMGHVRSYTIADVCARRARSQG